MGLQGFYLFLGLLLILLAAEFFTNGIEAFGRHFSFSQAVVGSIFAAVGTALPETILPLVAIFLYGGKAAKDIGVGAILGAPFMLATLAFFLVGVTVTFAAFSKRRNFELNIEKESLIRDLSFFVVMYGLAVCGPLIAGKRFSALIAGILFVGYLYYAYRTFRGESADIEPSGEIYFWRLLSRSGLFSSGQHPPLILIVLQIAAALALMIQGARTFVQSLERISIHYGMDPLLFALLLAPVATELPEKFNSVTWTWKGRDTLAIGNITGAMVFQAAFPVSAGLLFTDWNLTGMALMSAIIAIVSALIVLGTVLLKGRLSPFAVLSSGLLYVVYALVLIFR